MDKESYLLELCRYVVLNPVRAGPVGDTSEWGWSSYRATAGLQEIPDWLDVPSVLTLFDHSAATAQAAYRRFVEDGVNQPSPWRDVIGQIYLGSPEFLERIDRVVRGKSLVNVPSAQGRPRKWGASLAITHWRRIPELARQPSSEKAGQRIVVDFFHEIVEMITR